MDLSALAEKETHDAYIDRDDDHRVERGVCGCQGQQAGRDAGPVLRSYARVLYPLRRRTCPRCPEGDVPCDMCLAPRGVSQQRLLCILGSPEMLQVARCVRTAESIPPYRMVPDEGVRDHSFFYPGLCVIEEACPRRGFAQSLRARWSRYAWTQIAINAKVVINQMLIQIVTIVDMGREKGLQPVECGRLVASEFFEHDERCVHTSIIGIHDRIADKRGFRRLLHPAILAEGIVGHATDISDIDDAVERPPVNRVIDA